MCCKKIILVAAMCVLQYALIGQIVVESADMPAQGDTVRISVGLNTNIANYTETGEDFVWDFSALSATAQNIDTFVSVSSTPLAYQFFFSFNSNLANRYLSNVSIPNYELSEVYNFYKNTSSMFTNTGYAATINGLPLPIKFDNADVWYKFPLEYGNTYSSASNFEYSIPNMGYLTIKRTRKNTVDGWGKITTPFGTFDVLRIKSEVTEFDSTYIDSIQTGLPLNRIYTEYKWLAKGQKEPVLQITADNSGGIVVSYRDSARVIVPPVTVTEHMFDKNSLSVHPNPASFEVQIEFEMNKAAAIGYSLFDIFGREVYTSIVDNAVRGLNRKTINLRKYAIENGMYFLVINVGNKRYTKRLIVKR